MVSYYGTCEWLKLSHRHQSMLGSLVQYGDAWPIHDGKWANDNGLVGRRYAVNTLAARGYVELLEDDTVLRVTEQGRILWLHGVEQCDDDCGPEEAG